MTPSILVAGIGNIFNRDDAFGVAVAWRLSTADLPGNVRVRDFGIRGFDLALALMEGYDFVILVDALSRGRAPGTLYAFEPELADGGEAMVANAHTLDPATVLTLARHLGARPGRVIVLGCEPGALEDDSGRIDLSEPVQAAIDPAIEMIRSLIGDFNQRWTHDTVRSREECLT